MTILGQLVVVDPEEVLVLQQLHTVPNMAEEAEEAQIILQPLQMVVALYMVVREVVRVGIIRQHQL